MNRMSDKKGLLPLHLVFDRMISLILSNLSLIVFQSKQPIQIESLSVTLKESYISKLPFERCLVMNMIVYRLL